MMPETDRDVLDKGRPFIRAIAAFCLYLRFGGPKTSARPCKYNMGEAFCDANEFLDRLDKDLEDSNGPRKG